jgi:hypothetical protein
MRAALEDLHDASTELAAQYRAVGERHAADPDVFHMCETLAKQCEAQAAALRSAAARYDAQVDDDSGGGLFADLAALVRRTSSAAMGRTAKAGPLLLRDLRKLFVLACDCELAWTIVSQGAKAARDKELVELCRTCCEEVNGQVRWIKTRTKVAAPQVLVTG